MQEKSIQKPLLSLRNICFAYDGIIALRHIDLDVYAGETLIVQGDNGCGKTTLLKLLNGLLEAEEGSFTYAGKAVDGKALADDSFNKWFHQQVGFIWQDADVQLFCATVEEEIAFGPSQMGLSQQECQKRVEEMLELFDIAKLRDRAPYHLSGGEKRKVAVACILALNPELLVLDEPLSGLDKKSQLWLEELLQLLHEAGKTMIISTHNEKLAQSLGTRFVYINDRHELEPGAQPYPTPGKEV